MKAPGIMEGVGSECAFGEKCAVLYRDGLRPSPREKGVQLRWYLSRSLGIGGRASTLIYQHSHHSNLHERVWATKGIQLE